MQDNVQYAPGEKREGVDYQLDGIHLRGSSLPRSYERYEFGRIEKNLEETQEICWKKGTDSLR